MKVSDVAEAEKARRSKSKVKVLLIMFFDVRGIIHSEFLSQGQTISKQTETSRKGVTVKRLKAAERVTVNRLKAERV